MQPITRETIIDRRQPAIRWSAVFAGTAISVGIWMMLQILGTGVGLASINVHDAHNLHGARVGTTVWTMITPLISMLLGGLVAGRLAGTRDYRVGGIHGAVVWALSSVLGILAAMWMVKLFVLSSTPIEDVDRATNYDALQAAKDSGKALLGAGAAIFIGLCGAIAGGILAIRQEREGGAGSSGRLEPNRYDTLQTPVVPPPVTSTTEGY